MIRFPSVACGCYSSRRGREGEGEGEGELLYKINDFNKTEGIALVPVRQLGGPQRAGTEDRHVPGAFTR